MLDPVLTNPWVRAIGALLALALVCLLIYLLSPVLVPLFFAFLVAYVLDPIVDALEARRISRSLSIGLLAALALAVLVAIPVFVVPAIITESKELIEAARAERADTGGISEWFYGAMNKLPLESVVESLGWVPEDEPGYDPVKVLTVEIAERIREPLIQFSKSHALEIAATGEAAGAGLAQFAASLGRAFMNSLFFLGNLLLFAFVAVYLLKDFDGIIATAGGLIPLSYRERTSNLMSKIDAQLKGFLQGQMLVVTCLGLMYAIGLSISGVPFALLIAAFGAVASFIPYLGLILTIGPALVLCALQQQGIDWHFAGVLTTFIIAQTLEGTVLTPRIVGDKVGLSPVWVILAILVFGNALGFLGLLLAVPIAASLKVLVVEAVAYYKTSPLFTEAPPPAKKRPPRKKKKPSSKRPPAVSKKR